VCVDCGAKDPTWVSINLGTLMCLPCSGFHRSLGVHLSKVRSATLDKLDPFSMQLMCAIGNKKFNSVFEVIQVAPDGTRKPIATTSKLAREAWINIKYKQRDLMDPEVAKGKPEVMLAKAVASQDYLGCLQAVVIGANLSQPMKEDGEGITPLHEAVRNQDTTLVEILMKNGADVSVRDFGGWTPLHYAAAQDDQQMVGHLLLRGGAQQTTLRDVDGKAALDIAVEYSGATSQCKALLEEAKEKLDKKLRDSIVLRGVKQKQEADLRAEALREKLSARLIARVFKSKKSVSPGQASMPRNNEVRDLEKALDKQLPTNLSKLQKIL